MGEDKEILNCPFCGSVPSYDDHFDIVTCCGAVNPMSFERWQSRPTADTEGVAKGVVKHAKKVLQRVSEKAEKQWYHEDSWMIWNFYKSVISLLLEILKALKNHTAKKP